MVYASLRITYILYIHMYCQRTAQHEHEQENLVNPRRTPASVAKVCGGAAGDVDVWQGCILPNYLLSSLSSVLSAVLFKGSS